MSACKLHGQYSCDKCMLIAKQPTADLVARIAVDGAPAVQMQDRIAKLEADLAAARQHLLDAHEDFTKGLMSQQETLAAAQAERDDFKAAYLSVIQERKKAEAEAAALRVDAERGKWMIDHAEWWRDGDETRMVIRVADKADLSCYAMRELAIDQARGGGNG